jgi:hypothetical protein
VRLGLISDTHGYLPALEAAIAGCRKAGVDLIVHCGDFLTGPDPDPFGETISILRTEQVITIYGNSEIYLMHWGTPQWDATVAQRRRRPDSPDHFLPLVPGEQAQLSPDELAWPRALPPELVLDCARAGDVYVCHAMPGDPFNTPWDVHTIREDGTMLPDPQYAPSWQPGELHRAFSRPEVQNADLILCGHVPYPLVLRWPLPNGRHALVVRGVGFMQGEPDGTGWMVDYWILENIGPTTLGFQAWSLERQLQPFAPRRVTGTAPSERVQPPRGG